MNTDDALVDPKVAVIKFLENRLYAKLARNWSSKDLVMIANDRSKALEYARKGIEVTEPDKLNNSYINQIADGMQQVAKRTLEKRAK